MDDRVEDVISGREGDRPIDQIGKIALDRRHVISISIHDTNALYVVLWTSILG